MECWTIPLLLFFKSVSTIADVAGCRGLLTLKTAAVTDLLLFIIPFPRFLAQRNGADSTRTASWHR
jgi:hypothetical protein